MSESINIKLLLELSDGDREFVREILALFIQKTPIELERVRSFIKEKDAGGLSQTLHKIKSFTTPLGLPELRTKIARLEKVVKTHELATLQDELADFLSSMNNLTEKAKDQLAELNPD